MIHTTKDGTFSISAYHVWRPGVFATKTAAFLAQRLTDEQIIGLQKKVNENEEGLRVIPENLVREALSK